MLNQDELIEKVRTYNRFLNPDTLLKAYTFALNAHKNQKRDSGDPYLIHPVAVAGILADMHLDYQTLMAALLHDVIEDTDYSTKELTEASFNSRYSLNFAILFSITDLLKVRT